MKIGIVGSGRLGICMALCLDNAGYDVYCYDINKILLDNIINKTLETNEPKVKELLLNSKLKVLETEKDIVQTCDIIFIFIQTPSKKNGEYDHSYIDYFLDKIKNITDDEKIIVISSTVMPEYTDAVINNIEEIFYRENSVGDALQSIARDQIIPTKKNSPFQIKQFCFSLDYIFESFKLEYPNKIKIDVDGNEKKVFEGGKKVILNAKEIYFEDNDLVEDKEIIKEILKVFKIKKEEATAHGIDGRKLRNILFIRK